MAQENLKNRLLELSEASDWESARREWNLEEIQDSRDPQTCACGHTPIRKLCYIRNLMNSNKLLVGSCCVKNFLGIRSDLIFSALDRVRRDLTTALNREALRFGFDQGWINSWELDFYMDTCRKRKMSDRQLIKRMEINELFVKYMYDDAA
jgi:hypothetical protein